MAEPTIADIITRLDLMAQDSHRRETATIERHVKLETELKAEVKAIANGQATLNERLVAVEKLAPTVEANMRKAMKSADDLTAYVHDEVVPVFEKHSPLLQKIDTVISPKLDVLYKKLDAQDLREELKKEQAERDAQAKAENARNESISAKRLQEKRDFRIKVLTILVGLAAVAIPVAGSMYGSYLANQRTHDDYVAKFADLKADLKHVADVASAAPTAAYPPPYRYPEAAAAAPLPASKK